VTPGRASITETTSQNSLASVRNLTLNVYPARRHPFLDGVVRSYEFTNVAAAMPSATFDAPERPLLSSKFEPLLLRSLV